MRGGRQSYDGTWAVSSRCKTLRCSEWAWQNIKTRSNRRKNSFGELRRTRESNTGREEGLLVRRCKVMILLWKGALDPSVPLCDTLCTPCSLWLSLTLSSLWIRVSHTIFGSGNVIDIQTMSTMWSDSTLPGMLLSSLDLTYHFPVLVATGVYSSTKYKISDFVELFVGPKLWNLKSFIFKAIFLSRKLSNIVNQK